MEGILEKKQKRKYTRRKLPDILPENEIPNISSKITKSKRKYTRRTKKTNLESNTELTHEPKMHIRMNEKLSDLMSKLGNIMGRVGEPMKARAYTKAEETILSIDEDIITADILVGKPGIGTTVLKNIKEYLDTGISKVLEREKENPMILFTDIYGVGPKKASELVTKGFKTIKELREKKDQVLNAVQRVGLTYYEDILKRIPRPEIDKYNDVFSSTLKMIGDKDSEYEIVGSFRRGHETSGDIDVIITSKSPEVFVRFVDRLIEKNIIVEVLSRGKTKSLVICKLPGTSVGRRVDFLYTNREEFPFAILYFTGSKGFNTVMRGFALKKGYSLNEHGIYKMPDKTVKAIHDFKEEKDIFDFLGIKYKTPEERVDGRAVIPIENNVLQIEQQVTQQTQEKQENLELKNLEKSDKVKKQPKKMKKSEALENIRRFQKSGISVLDTLSEKDIEQMLDITNIAYRNEDPIISDNEYDIIQDYMADKYPKNTILQNIGAPVTGKNKVLLPYEMASMDKIKPEMDSLPKWTAKYTGPYILSCKLDGVSGLYVTDSAGNAKLYTRGDGKVGQDVTHLIPSLKLPKHKGYAIRGEFIMKKEVFDAKYKTSFANPRNLVSGIVNSKSADTKVNDLKFVTYEVVSPDLKPSDQMAKLLELGHETVQNKMVRSLTNDSLSELLVDWRENYEYEIDGVIVTNDQIYPRASGNPDHSFAFKMVISDQLAETRVLDVIWAASKNGLLKPRVRVDPIQLRGVKIEYASGFNGKFITDNKIGIGAVVQIVRSGDVIPYIKTIVLPAQNPKMPEEPYIWDDNHVEVILENAKDNVIVQEKNAFTFFSHLQVDGLGLGNIHRIFDAGFNTVSKILKMTIADFETVEGFKKKMAEKIHGSISDKIRDATILDIATASNRLGKGIGERKLKIVLQAFPTIFSSTESQDKKVQMLRSIDGIGPENASEIVKRIPDFIAFLEECGLSDKLVLENGTKEVADTTQLLYNKKIVMTKIRDKEIIDALAKFGGILEDSMKKDTFALIVKSMDDTSNKTEYAKKNGIPILTPSEFKEKYLG